MAVEILRLEGSIDVRRYCDDTKCESKADWVSKRKIRRFAGMLEDIAFCDAHREKFGDYQEKEVPNG